MAKSVNLSPAEAVLLLELLNRIINAWHLTEAESPIIFAVHDKLQSGSRR
jgi:hypothetical protein